MMVVQFFCGAAVLPYPETKGVSLSIAA